MRRGLSRTGPIRLKRTIRWRKILQIRRFAGSELVGQSSLMFGATTLFNVAGYAYHLVLSRMLGVQHYGELLALLSFVLICSAVGGIVNTVVVKIAAEFFAVGNEAHLSELFRVLVRGCAGVVVPLALIGFLASSTVASYLHVSSMSAVAWTFFAIGVAIVLPALRGVMQGAHLFRLFAGSLVVEAVAKVAFGYFFVVAGFGVAGGIAATAAASSLSAVALIVVGYLRFSLPSSSLHIGSRRLLQTIWGVSISTVALALLTSGDVILVKHYFSAYDAGLYGIASLAGKSLLFVGAFVPMLVLPKATAYATSGKSVRLLFLQAVSLIGLFGLAGIAVFSLAPVMVVRLLGGGNFTSAAQYVLPYGIAMVILSATSLVCSFRTAMHRFAFVARLAVTAVAELLAISFYHRSLLDVVYVIICGNLVAFLSVAWGMFPKRPHLAGAMAVTAVIASNE